MAEPRRIMGNLVRHLGGRRGVLALLLASALGLSSLPIQARAEDPVPADDDRCTEQVAKMRDGTELAADVCTPEGEGPWPVILMRTPYLKSRDRERKSYRRYTEAGYVAVVQDVRGRGESKGRYIPFINDRQDGYDSVEWAAAQSWSNGKVGMSGASARGITAMLAATEEPPALAALYVQVTPHLRFDEGTFVGGVFKQADTGRWMEFQGAGAIVPLIKRRAVWDAQWEAVEIGPHLNQVRVPVFNNGGWYDIFSYGTLRNFMYLQNFGAPGAKGRQKLIMGPYGHGPISGDLDYQLGDLRGDSSYELRWFDHWMKGEQNGIMDEPPVRYYMMAAARKGKLSERNGWRSADSWPPPHVPTSLYLRAKGRLAPDPGAESEPPLGYAFDPEKPVPTIGGANLTLERGPMDQRAVGERADYLRFETPPFKRPFAIAGPVEADLFVSTDGPDTDVMVKLVDVYPDGYEALVLDAPLRLRYRNGRRAEDVEMMQPGQPTRVEIDLWHTAITFEPGHKLALHISSSNSPRFEVNDNSGTPPGEEVKPRIARNQIFVDAAHASALVLPVLVESSEAVLADLFESAPTTPDVASE